MVDDGDGGGGNNKRVKKCMSLEYVISRYLLALQKPYLAVL